MVMGCPLAFVLRSGTAGNGMRFSVSDGSDSENGSSS